MLYSAVQRVLSVKHTTLGNHVALTRCTVSSESSGYHGVDASTGSVVTKSLPQNARFPIEVPKHYLMCIENQQQQLDAQLKVYCAAMNVDKKKSEIIIIPCKGNEMIKDWQSHCKNVIDIYLQGLKTEPLNIPLHKKDLMSPLINTIIQTEKLLNIEYDEDRSLVIIAGEQNEVNRVKKHFEDTCKSIVENIVPIDDKKHFLLINIKIDELLSRHSEVKATVSSDNQTITVLGFKDKCNNFIDDLTKLKSKIQTVQVLVTSMFTQFLSQQVGKDLVQYYLQEFQSEVTTYFDAEGNLFVLGSSDSTAANDLATKIQNSLCFTHVSYPVLFQKSIETAAWTTLSACLERKHFIQISVLKNEIKVIGDSQMSKLAKKEIEQFIDAECWSEKCFPLCDTQWRCIRIHFSKKWKKLLQKLKKENEIKLIVPSSNEKDPCIIIKGEKPSVVLLERKVEAFLALVVSSPNPIHETRLGIVKYFCSEEGRAKVQLIESQQRSCVQIDIRENFPKQLTVAVNGSQCCEVCSGTTAEDKIVILYHGDITTLSVDVIVNVTDVNLKHTEGVALAIANKGGPCIQKDCDAYFQTVSGINEGDFIFAKNVGNLPCKSLIHVVSPTWRGDTSNERQILTSMCFKALEAAAANHFQTVSLPVVGSGKFGFPVDISAKIMIETVIQYSQTNPSTSIREISFVAFYQHEATIFCKEMKQLFPTALVTKATNASSAKINDVSNDKVGATGNHYTNNSVDVQLASIIPANQPVDDRNFNVFQNIEVHKGNLLDYPVSLLSSDCTMLYTDYVYYRLICMLILLAQISC